MSNWGRRWAALAAAVVAMLAATVPAVAAEQVRLGTTAWPPYIGADLPGLGATAQVVGSALAAAGAELVPVFQPAVDIESGFGDRDIDGIFPVYATRMRERVCLMSGQIGSSPLGFAERLDHPLTWTRLEDLAPYTLGVVRNYANTDSFDRLVTRGVLQVVRAPDDTQNLQNLLDGRIDLAVIDRNVMEWLLRRDPALSGRLNAVRFNPRPIAERPLYACFRNDATGRAKRDRLNAGLAAIDGPLMTADWFRRMIAAP